MTTPAYPLDLRTIIRATKSRSQPAAFMLNTPRRGTPYAQAIGTVAPQQWSVQFRFDEAEAVRFMLWFSQILLGGELEFTMPLRTETGVVEHLLQFLPDGLADCREEGETFVYDAMVVGAPV